MGLFSKNKRLSLLPLYLSVCLVLFGTSQLLHEAHHSLEDDIAECSICMHASDADDFLPQSQHISPKVTVQTNAVVPASVIIVAKRYSFYTSRAPPSLVI
jgi:hypothetical protein